MTRPSTQVSTLVVDDEELARRLVGSFVRRDPELLLVGECEDGAEALDFIERRRPDLVFLDVQMPVMNGIELARRVARLDVVPYIVFVTAFDEFAIDAFELDALDYLVKPVEKARFRASVERAKVALRDREMLGLTARLLRLGRQVTGSGAERPDAQELTIRDGNEVLQLTTDDIVWIEAANQYVQIHTEGRSYTVGESLGQYAKRIEDPRFFRIHRSALVNAAAVRRVTRQRNGTHLLELVVGEPLVVARSRAAIVPDILRAARQAGSHVG